MPAIKRGDLTMPDMAVLRLLSDRPMHGHQASLELARRKLRMWPGVSRPQVYWSLNKLEKMGLICTVETGDTPPPRQRRVYTPTEAARKALEKSLSHKYWTTQILRPMFLAWVVLAHDVAPDIVKQQVRRRMKFLKHELTRERNSRRAIHNGDPARSRAAEWVMGLSIEQLESEIRWLRKLHMRSSGMSQRYGKTSQSKFLE